MSTWHNQGDRRAVLLNGRHHTRGTQHCTIGTSIRKATSSADEFPCAGEISRRSWSSRWVRDDGQLYFVNNSSGSLNRIAFTGGVPTGSASVVSSGDWRARGVFLFQGPPNQPPAASFSSSCQELACGFNGTASSDPDGTITSYAWDFGEGATATGAQPMHTFAAAGTYLVKLTVTDNLGGTGSVTHNVQASVEADRLATAGLNATATRRPSPYLPGSSRATACC
jgi:hypothetical protein